MSGLLVLAALPLMLLGGFLLDVATLDDAEPQDEDAPPEVNDISHDQEPLT